MTGTNETHDPAQRSWVNSANSPGSDFPVQNLPYGRFRRFGAGQPWRIGIAIGNQVLDLHAAHTVPGWPADLALPLAALAGGDLNAVMALPAAQRQALRRAFSAALRESSIQAPTLDACLLAQADAEGVPVSPRSPAGSSGRGRNFTWARRSSVARARLGLPSKAGSPGSRSRSPRIASTSG